MDTKIFNKILANQIQQCILYHGQVGFIQGMQEFLNICKSISVIHHINKLKNRNHMIISIDTEKAFDKIQHHLWQKDSPESGHRGNLPQHKQGHIRQTYRWIMLNGEKLKAFPLRSGTGQRTSIVTTSVQQSFGSPSHGRGEEKEIKGIQIGKQIKLSLFADDMILYTENPNGEREREREREDSTFPYLLLIIFAVSI